MNTENEYTNTPDDDLRSLLAELEETANEVRTELEARGKVNGNGAEAPVDKYGLTQEQLDELDKVPYYLANLRGRWSNLFDLLSEFRNEIREGHQEK